MLNQICKLKIDKDNTFRLYRKAPAIFLEDSFYYNKNNTKYVIICKKHVCDLGYIEFTSASEQLKF